MSLKTIIAIVIFVAIGVIIDTEIVNNMVLIQSNETLAPLEGSAKLLRSQVWPIHLGTSISLSILIGFYFHITSAPVKHKMVSVVMTLTGIYLFFLGNQIILFIHIATALIAVGLFIPKVEHVRTGIIALLGSMYVFMMFLALVHLDEELVMTQLMIASQLASVGISPVEVLGIKELIKEDLNNVLRVISVVFVVVTLVIISTKFKEKKNV